MGENIQHFQHILLYYFKKDKNATETQRFMHCMEKVLQPIKRVKGGLQSSVLEVSLWTMLHGWVDWLKLIAIKSRH